MRGTLRFGTRSYELADRGASALTNDPLAADRAISLVRRAQWEPSAMRTLRSFLSDGASRLGGAEVVDRIGARLRSGRLELREVAQRRVEFEPVEAPVAEQKEAPAESWIAFRVIDDESEEGIQGVELQVVLPGASDPTSFRTAAGSGEVRIEGIHPGSCDIAKMLDELGYEVVAVEG